MLRSGYVRVKGGCCVADRVVTERALTDGLRTDWHALATPPHAQIKQSTALYSFSFHTFAFVSSSAFDLAHDIIESQDERLRR